MCDDIFAALRLWRDSLLTTGHLSSSHPVVVGAGDVAWGSLWQDGRSSPSWQPMPRPSLQRAATALQEKIQLPIAEENFSVIGGVENVRLLIDSKISR